MKVIEAPNKVILEEDDIVCFLAGGICNCPNWQKEVIKYLEDMPGTEHLVILNPRRENFDIDKDDPYTQIEWEFNELNHMDIFSMYFAKSEKSVQPICMYELGRHLTLMPIRFPKDWTNRVIISVDPEYSRKNDVYIQTELAVGIGNIAYNVEYFSSPEAHANSIYHSYKKLYYKR